MRIVEVLYDKQQRTWQEMVILATRLAIEGNSSALREVWSRVDGKVTDLIPEQVRGP